MGCRAAGLLKRGQLAVSLTCWERIAVLTRRSLGLSGHGGRRVGDGLRAVWGFGPRFGTHSATSRGTIRGCAHHVTNDVRGSHGAATALPAAPRTNDSVRRNGLSAQGVSAQHFEGFVPRRVRSASDPSTNQSRSVANSPTANDDFAGSSDHAEPPTELTDKWCVVHVSYGRTHSAGPLNTGKERKLRVERLLHQADLPRG